MTAGYETSLQLKKKREGTIKYERPCLNTFPNTNKRAESTTNGGVVVKQSWVSDYIFSIETKAKRRNKIAESIQNKITGTVMTFFTTLDELLMSLRIKICCTLSVLFYRRKEYPFYIKHWDRSRVSTSTHLNSRNMYSYVCPCGAFKKKKISCLIVPDCYVLWERGVLKNVLLCWSLLEHGMADFIVLTYFTDHEFN